MCDGDEAEFQFGMCQVSRKCFVLPIFFKKERKIFGMEG